MLFCSDLYMFLFSLNRFWSEAKSMGPHFVYWCRGQGTSTPWKFRWIFVCSDPSPLRTLRFFLTITQRLDKNWWRSSQASPNMIFRNAWNLSTEDIRRTWWSCQWWTHKLCCWIDFELQGKLSGRESLLICLNRVNKRMQEVWCGFWMQWFSLPICMVRWTLVLRQGTGALSAPSFVMLTFSGVVCWEPWAAQISREAGAGVQLFSDASELLENCESKTTGFFRSYRSWAPVASHWTGAPWDESKSEKRSNQNVLGQASSTCWSIFWTSRCREMWKWREPWVSCSVSIPLGRKLWSHEPRVEDTFFFCCSYISHFALVISWQLTCECICS